MKKALQLANSVVVAFAIALTLGTSYPVNAYSNSNCPSLDHPVRSLLTQHFRTESHSGKINNVFRFGNYSAASLWKRDSSGRAISASHIAIEFEGDRFNQAVLVTSSVADVLESWGASPETAQRTLQLLAESGI